MSCRFSWNLIYIVIYIFTHNKLLNASTMERQLSELIGNKGIVRKDDYSDTSNNNTQFF